MGGFLTFVAVVGGIIWLARYLRRRELDKFHQTDLRTLRELTGGEADSLPQSTGSSPAPAAPPAGKGGGREAIPPPESPVEPQPPVPPPAAPETGVTLKRVPIDEVHIRFLELLEELLGPSVRVFVRKPLADIVRAPGGPGELIGRHVSFVVCRRDDYQVLFGVSLKGAGAAEVAKQEYLSAVFAEIGIPLVTFPLTNNPGRAEVEAELVSRKLLPAPRPPGSE